MGRKNKKAKKDVHAGLQELFELDEGCKLGWKKKTLTAAFPDDDAAAGAAFMSCIQSTGQRDHMTVTAVRASKTVGRQV